MIRCDKLFLQILVVGVTTGAIYALIALGYTMVYGIIELINFAHGDIFMIGTFICISIFGLFGITNSSVAPTGSIAGGRARYYLSWCDGAVRCARDSD